MPDRTGDSSKSLLEHAEPEEITAFFNLDISISESTPKIEIFRLDGNLDL